MPKLLLTHGFYRISDLDAPKEVIEHLGYSINSAPFALLLEKNVELFVDLKNECITIPRTLYKPGSFFPFARILSRKNNRVYAPNGVLTMTSGARSTFMLPNIGCMTNHSNLQRNFNVKNPPAKSLYEHWEIFKQIVQLQRITQIFIEELEKKDSLCSATVIQTVSKNIELDFFHNKNDSYRTIKSSFEIFKNDDRFQRKGESYLNAYAKFAADAPFLRGCVSIKVNVSV